MKKKKTIVDFQQMYDNYEPWTMAIAYDYVWANLVEQTDIEILFCGDSVGMIHHGYDDTLPVTLEQMIDHGKACRRGAPNTHLMVDMPFGSYQEGPEQAVRNAIRLVKETGCDSIKMEGGREIAPQIRAVVNSGIVVMAHLGLMPSRMAIQGGFKAQGRDTASARMIIEDALAAYEAGAQWIGLEGVPKEVCEFIGEMVPVPVTGARGGGGGNLYDAFHMIPGAHLPKFAYQTEYDFGNMALDGLRKMHEQTKSRAFDTAKVAYTIKQPASEFAELFDEFRNRKA